MLDYGSCSTIELLGFVRRRGLTLRAPTRAQCIITLRKADASYSFRLLDIPPEMRNRIYRELLVFRGDHPDACHPQILATSKQVNAEATSILYGDNTIRISITPLGIHTRNLLCGPYLRPPIPHQRQTKEYYWPCYLQRARHLRLVIETTTGPQPNNAIFLPHVASSHSAVYDLCRRLQPRNRLATIVVELEGVPNLIDDRNEILRVFSTAICPLRLFTSVKIVQMEGFPDNYSHSLTPAPALLGLANDLVAGWPWICASQLKAAISATILIGSTPRDWSRLWAPGFSSVMSLIHLVLDRSPEAMRKEFEQNISRLRLEWEGADQLALDPGIMASIDELIRLDIEVKRLLGEQGRFAELDSMG